MILKDNSDIPGAHVGLALSRKNDEVYVGLSISLDPIQPLQVTQEKAGAMSNSKGSGMFAHISNLMGPFVGVVQNARDFLLKWFCGATARRMGLERGTTVGEATLAEVHRALAKVVVFGSLPLTLGPLLSGSLNPTWMFKYLIAVVVTDLCSSLYEQGRERYQRTVAKKPDTGGK